MFFEPAADWLSCGVKITSILRLENVGRNEINIWFHALDHAASTKSYDATISLKAIDNKLLLAFKTDLDVVDNKVIKRIFMFKLSPYFKEKIIIIFNL